MGPDLALALELADAADGISLGRFRASDLVIETKPDSTPVTEADRAVERELRSVLARERPDDAILGEEEGASGDGTASLDHRSDRRHPELLARRPGLGDADRARGGRRGDARRRLGAGAASALVGRAGRRRLREWRPRPRLRNPADRGRGAQLRRRAADSGDRRPGLARTGLRRLLEPHARRRGRDRRRHRRGRRHRVGPRRDPADRRGGRRDVHRLQRGEPDRQRQRDLIERAPARRAAWKQSPRLVTRRRVATGRRTAPWRSRG